jgi:hypothetical protein
MAVKLIMTWDITPGHEQEYFEFVIREFLPGMQRLGFELSDAWATAYGRQPQIMVGAILPSQEKIWQLMHTSEWKNLHDQLQTYIVNYNEKIVPSRGGFQF